VGPELGEPKFRPKTTDTYAMKVFLLFILIVNGVFAGERLYRPEHFSLSLLEKELVHENIGFLEGRGVRALELGDYVLAIQYFTKVAFIEPKRTSVNYYLGETERRLGNGAGAVKYFREIVAEERGEALFFLTQESHGARSPKKKILPRLFLGEIS